MGFFHSPHLGDSPLLLQMLLNDEQNEDERYKAKERAGGSERMGERRATDWGEREYGDFGRRERKRGIRVSWS